MARKKTIKILFLHHFPLWGCGSGTYVRNLALELSKLKSNEVAILCPENRKLEGIKIYEVKLPFFVAFTGHPEHPGCRLYSQLTEREITRIYKTFLYAAIDAVEDFKPNIIHANHASIFTWVARYLKAIYNIPYITSLHGTDLQTIEIDKRYFYLTREGLKNAKKITAVSGDTREWFYRIFGKFDFHHKTRTIPGGIDLDKCPQEINTKEIEKEYHLENKSLILFCGKLTPYKGVRYLVKAAQYINGEIFIIGDGPEKKTLKNLAADLKLKNIHLLGYLGEKDINKLHQFYARADVFVAPSVWDEPLGMVILEAMAYSTPVVVTRKGGIPLAVKDGLNGYFVKPRNSKDIAEKVNKLLADSEKRKIMGENARKIVAKKFTWEKITKRFLRIYHLYADFNKNNGKNDKK